MAPYSIIAAIKKERIVQDDVEKTRASNGSHMPKLWATSSR